jgi:hypothetical protein
MPSGRREKVYEIREVFYTNGQSDGITMEAMAPVGSTVRELRESLVFMLRATYAPVVRISDCDSKLRARMKRRAAK